MQSIIPPPKLEENVKEELQSASEKPQKGTLNAWVIRILMWAVLTEITIIIGIVKWSHDQNKENYQIGYNQASKICENESKDQQRTIDYLRSEIEILHKEINENNKETEILKQKIKKLSK